MSRFFRQAGDSDSESEESDEELMSSGDEETAPSRPAAPSARPAMARFLNTAGSDSDDSSSDDSESDDEDQKDGASDDEEEGKTIRILSAQEKRLAEMEATGTVIANARKINDWVAISNG
jgi:translation initiation factor 3 subunit C